MDYTAGIDGSTLIITLDKNMEFGKTYELYIPVGAVVDAEDTGYPSREFELKFTVEEKLDSIQVISSSPADREKFVSPDINEVSITFNYDYLLEGDAFDIITLKTADEEIPIIPNLNNNAVRLSFEPQGKLELGRTYEVHMPQGVVKDRFGTESETRVIKFRTKAEDVPPQVVSTYPANGETGVNIDQAVEIIFSEKVDFYKYDVLMLDDKGNRVKTDRRVTAKNDQTRILLTPTKPLEANVEYTILLPEDKIKDSSENYLVPFNLSFTTGADLLGMDITNIDDRHNVAITTDFNIQFSSAVTRGPYFKGINIMDLEGEPVYFTTTDDDDTVVLELLKNLEPGMAYTLVIPEGAFKNTYNEINDVYRLKFTAASPLSGGIIYVKPFNRKLFINMPFTFDAESFYSWFSANGREILSYKWEFGDGHVVEGGKIVEHAYEETGDYQVTLTIQDNKGLTSEHQKTVSIIPYPDKVDVSCKAMDSDTFYAGRYSSSNTATFEIGTYCEQWGDIIPVPYRKVSLELFDGDNKLYKSLGEVVTDENGKAYYNLNYHDISGRYNLSTGDSNTFFIVRPRNNIKIKVEVVPLNNSGNYDNWDPKSITLDIDGKIYRTKKDDNNDNVVWVNSGRQKIKVVDDYNGFTSDVRVIDLVDDTKITIPVKMNQTGLPFIWWVTSINKFYLSGVDKNVQFHVKV